jgi:hypothetical protein
MNEILLIFFQLVLFLTIFSYPINIFNCQNLIKTNFINIYFIFSINIIIHFTFYLIISFTSVNIEYFFYLEILLSLLFCFIYKKKIYSKLKQYKFKDYKFFLIFVATNLLFFLTIAAYPKLQWDGLAHWVFKSKLFFDGGNYFDLKDNVPFSYYPHLGTFIWGYFWKNSFMGYEYFGRCVYAFIYLLSLFLTTSYFFDKNKNENLNKQILLTIFLLVISIDFFLFGGYQEYLLFFLFLILGLLSILHLQNLNANFILFLIILNLNLICWSKQEGFFYVIIIGVILSFFNYKNLKNFLIFLLFTIFICLTSLTLKSFVIENGFFNEKIINPEILEYLNLKVLINDLLIISKHFVISSFKYPVIIIGVSLLCIFIRKITNKIDIYFYILFLINLLFIISIYLQTSMDIEYLLPITVDRILLQTSGMYLIYLAYKIRTFYD